MDIETTSHPFYGRVSGFASDSSIFAHVKSGEIWKPNILEAINKYVLPDSLCIDAGAYIGLHSIAMSLAQSSARVVSFEPNPYIFPLLKANLDSNSMVTLNQTGLGKENSTFFARSVRGSTNPGGAGLFEYQLDFSSSEPDIEVTVKPLDDFDFQDVSVIKIDVEGMEMDVISGASKLLKKMRPVMIVKILDLDEPKLRLKKIRKIERIGYTFKMLSPVDFLFVRR